MEKFEHSLPMMLHRALDAIIPKFRDVFKDHGISEQQWRILRVLWEVDECTSAELAAKTLIPSPSMVGVIDRMSKKDLVHRTRCNADRRIIRVALTEKGRALQAEVQPQVDKIYSTMISGCDEASWQIMMDTLQVVVDTNQKTK